MTANINQFPIIAAQIHKLTSSMNDNQLPKEFVLGVGKGAVLELKRMYAAINRPKFGGFVSGKQTIKLNTVEHMTEDYLFYGRTKQRPSGRLTLSFSVVS